jgi:hypothetical protein
MEINVIEQKKNLIVKKNNQEKKIDRKKRIKNVIFIIFIMILIILIFINLSLMTTGYISMVFGMQIIIIERVIIGALLMIIGVFGWWMFIVFVVLSIMIRIL